MAGNKNSGRRKQDTSKTKGRGWHGDPERHRMAGSLGGQATLQEMGTEFYSQIGRQGGSVSPGNFKNDPVRASLAGRKGGQSRKKNDDDDLDDADMVDQAA